VESHSGATRTLGGNPEHTGFKGNSRSQTDAILVASAFGTDFHFLARIVGDADAGVIEAEGALHFLHNLIEQFDRLLAGDRCLGNVVQE